jgi:hypothetical protein
MSFRHHHKTSSIHLDTELAKCEAQDAIHVQSLGKDATRSGGHEMPRLGSGQLSVLSPLFGGKS